MRSKYGVAPKDERTYNNIVFDSKREMNRYCELVLLQRAGEICDLVHHPKPLLLEVNGQKIGAWEPDFTYTENGQLLYEDSKGFRTPEYKIKKKLVKACLGIEIKET